MEKLDIELDIIKCKIHEEDLQDEFKEKLEEKLNSACESRTHTTIKSNKKIINMPCYFYKSVAAVFICIFMFSSCAFAGGVGDWIKEMFSNVDKEMEIAYENGDMKKVDTEYQTFDGVSVRVEYVTLKDNELYVVFNVENAEKYEDISFNSFVIKDELNNSIYDTDKDLKKEENKCDIRVKSNTKTSSTLFLSIIKKDNFELYDNLNIEIKEICFLNDNDARSIYGNWRFNINL